MIFKNVTQEQMRRLDPVCGFLSSEEMILRHDVSSINALNLLSTKESLPTSKEIDLAAEILEKCSVNSILFVWGRLINKEYNPERIALMQGKIIPLVVKVCARASASSESFRPSRNLPYVQHAPMALSGFVFTPKYDIFRDGNKFIKRGASFKVLYWEGMEHGAVDITADLAVGGRAKFVCFPDEIVPLGIKW